MQSQDTYNRGGFIAFIFSMAFSLLFFVYISFIHPGVDLKEIPESEVEETGLVIADGEAPAAEKKIDVSSVADPWMSSEDMIAHGAKVYKTNCAICHGDKGMGDGAAGAGLVPKPRNLVEGQWKVGGTRVSLYTTLLKGLEGTSMAAFAHIPKNERWALVHWMRSITKNKKDEPDDKVAEFAKGAE